MNASDKLPRISDLQAALVGAGSGGWVLDTETAKFTSRFGFHDQMFGYPECQSNWSHETAQRHMIEEDRAKYLRSIEDGVNRGILNCEVRVRWPDGEVHWIRLRGATITDDDGVSRRLAGEVVDVSADRADVLAAHAMSRRLAFLERLGEALRAGGDARTLQSAACQVLGKHLAANRVFYCEVDESGWNTAGPQYVDGVSPSESIWRTEDYDSTLIEAYRDRRILSCNDVSRAPHLTAIQQQAYAHEEIASWAAVPIFGRGLPVGRLVVHRRVPHVWTAEELTLISDTAERVWPLIQRARTESKLLETTLDLERAQRVASLGSYRYDPVRHEYALSPEAMRLFGLEKESGVTEQILLGRIHESDRASVEEAWKFARNGRVVDLEYRTFSTGGLVWVHQRFETEFVKSGALLATFGTVQDISVRRELTDALRRNEERLRLALDAAKMGVWDNNLLTGEVKWSEGCSQLLGFNSKIDEPSAANWFAHIHPDDLAAVRAKVAESNSVAQGVVVDFRVSSAEGLIRWVEAHGRSETDQAGRPVRSYGVLMDVTQRKFSESRLLESEARFRTLFQYLPVAYQSLNIKGEWIDANQKMADLLGFSSPSEMLGQNFADFWSDELHAEPETPFEKFKRYNEINGQLELVRRDGRKVMVMISGRVERDVEKRFVRTHCILFDVTERESMEREIRTLNTQLEKRIEERTAELAAANVALARLARHDELTGLPNRLAANERLRLEFVSMKRTLRPYSVLMMDIDHFKRVNDRHGHAIGDRVLRRIAAVFQGSIRARDFVCRFGGEEFLVLLPETDSTGASIVAEKIRQAVLNCDDAVAGPVTISIGAAVASPLQTSEDDAVREADERLYKAKRMGRNKTVGAEV